MNAKEKLIQNEELWFDKKLAWLKEEIEQKKESNRRWILNIWTEIINEIEWTGEKDEDIRNSRNFELKNIWRNSFELESFWQKMVFEWNYIYDMTSWSRFEVMKIEKDLFDESNFFKQDANNKETIATIIKTMNIINKIKSEDYSRDLKYFEDKEKPGIYATNMIRDTLILNKDAIEKLSIPLWVDTINLWKNISKLINTIKKTKELNPEG